MYLSSLLPESSHTIISIKYEFTHLKQGDPLSPVLFNLVLQKVIQSIKMVPSGIKIGKEQLNTWVDPKVSRLTL